MGVYTNTQAQENKPDCLVCGNEVLTLTIPSTDTLETLIETLKTNGMGLQAPSLTSGAKTLYMRKPAMLEVATRPNLSKRLEELLNDGDEVVVSDPAVEKPFGVRVKFLVS